MDLHMDSIADLLKSKICRCCWRHNSSKQISMEYFYNGEKEVYDDMIRNTLDIQLSHLEIDRTSSFICEQCILKLRDASTFKKMILDCEEKFIQLIERLKETKVASSELMVEQIKVESFSTMDYHDFGDDEILANIKLELPQNGGILEPATTEISHEKKNKLKKCKIKSDLGPNKKDWSKIAERRGSGPILRENSLKLLANSTIFVFQWNKSRYRCFCCKEPFSDVNLLKNHTKTKHNLRAIEKKIINQQNRLVKVEISELKCNICSQNLNNLNDLRRHLIETHNIKFESHEDLLVPFKINDEYICQICDEKFNVFRLLNIHVNKHYQKQVCHICGAGFSNLVFLNLHKTRSHRPLRCRQCDLSFSNKIEKKKHDISVHDAKFERKLRFPCPYCNDRFYQENFRVEHLVEKHGLKRPEFKCRFCSKVFITKSLCNNHLKSVHLKEKCHECDICHNFFYTKSDVARHKVTHTGEKNFSCNMCQNPFASKDSLRRHMRRTHVVN